MMRPGFETYLFQFDAYGENAEFIGYHIGFDGTSNKKYNKKIELEKAKEWVTYSDTLQIPAGATELSLYLYAYESDKLTTNIVRYDNVQLIKVPPIHDKYYFVSTPDQVLSKPSDVKVFDGKIEIASATTSFFLIFEEQSYTSLHLKGNLLEGALSYLFPFVGPKEIDESYRINLENGKTAWYIDVEKYCVDQNLCEEISEGTFEFILRTDDNSLGWVEFIFLMVSILYIFGLFRFARIRILFRSNKA